MKKWILLLSFFPRLLGAEILEDYYHLGRNAFEAGDYSGAEQAFQSIQKMPLTKEQIAVASYNKACVFLKAKKWNQGIEAFEKTIFMEKVPPRLRLKAEYNLAFLLRFQAQDIETNLDERKEEFSEKIQEAMQALEKAKKFLKDTTKTLEKLMIVEGRTDPKMPESFQDLSASIKLDLIKLKQRQYIYALSTMTLEKAAPLLISKLQASVRSLKNLEELSLEKEFKDSYLRLFSQRALEHMPVWDSVRLDIDAQEAREKENKDWKFQVETYKEAERHHLQAVKNMEEGDLELALSEELKALSFLQKIQKDSENDQGDQDSQSDSEGSEGSSPQEVLQALLQMEQDDQEGHKRAGPVKQGVKPW